MEEAEELLINQDKSNNFEIKSNTVVIANSATITTTQKLNVTGDVTIAEGKTMTVADGSDIIVSGKIYNNGTFTMDASKSYVFCNGIVTGAGATWAPTPQW